ncbi:glycosyltransferase family 4 protein [Stagnimonas aquatica]|uniref:Glycosyltransferase family 4 protein n=1 Tax=Stagnimonas aquatica TaxID=2689987 RepID=A0A3N0V964_9GAMM|nr:glycosyltransferase family 4 protein [Stagnimonas aquatica]ROH89154.1 glycosyltransferase family 4 protein [Stagnimonas aquatica]
MSLKKLKVAVVHDWLPLYGGAERVLEQILLLFPQADLFTLVDLLEGDNRQHILHKNPKTSFVDRWAFTRKRYRSFLPLMPLAVEQFDLSDYQLVISSSSAVAKGVITGPDQLHICYCHSPIRYAWDLQHQYLRESGLESGFLNWLARWFLHRIRLWDVRTANGVDHFACNSEFVRRRIWKVYRREAEVIHPPVDMTSFQCQAVKQNYYVTASRMVPYKRIDLIVEAFANMPDHKLVVIGDGPEFSKIRSKAGANVELLGHVPYEVLYMHLRNAKAFMFAAEEDFGITPVEAQACGTPVIAYGKGGALETVRGIFTDAPKRDRMTGVFFSEQTVDSIVAAVQRFEQVLPEIRAEDCRSNAERFSIQKFSEVFAQFVERSWGDFEKTAR